MGTSPADFAAMMSGAADSSWRAKPPPDKGAYGVFEELILGIQADVGKSLKSIPHLPEAIFWMGRKDPEATPEVEGLRRRSIALAATTLATAGLGTLAGLAARGVGGPVLGMLMSRAGSIPAAAVGGAAENVMFNRLDVAPGEKPSDIEAALGGALIGTSFRGLGKAWTLAGKKVKGITPPPAVKTIVHEPGEQLDLFTPAGFRGPGGDLPGAQGELFEHFTTKARTAAGETVSEVKPVKASDAKRSASAAMWTELNESHPELAGEAGREARLEYISGVLGRPIKTTKLAEGEMDVADYRAIHQALRGKRGEIPLRPTAPPTVVRISKTMSVGFPDADHARLFELGRTGQMDDVTALAVGNKLGIDAKEVPFQAAMYHSLTNLAADANRGKGVMFKMPSLPDALEMMPEWMRSAQETGVSRVTATRPRAVKTAGDIAVTKEVRKAESTFDPEGNQAVAESKGAKPSAGPPPATLSHIMVGRRKIDVVGIRGNIVTLRYGSKKGGKQIKINKEELWGLIKDYTGHGQFIKGAEGTMVPAYTGNVVKAVEWGDVEHVFGKAPGPGFKAKEKTAIGKLKASIRKAQARGDQARVSQGLARLRAMEKAEHVKVMNTLGGRLRKVLDETRAGGLKIDPLAGRKIMAAFEEAKLKGDPSILGRSIEEMAFGGPDVGKKFLQTTKEALERRGDVAGAAEFEIRNNLATRLSKITRGLLKVKGSGPAPGPTHAPIVIDAHGRLVGGGGKITKAAQGRVPDLIEELFGRQPTVAGAKPLQSGRRIVKVVKSVRTKTGETRYVTISRAPGEHEKAGRFTYDPIQAKVTKLKRRITWLEKRLESGNGEPGDAATVERLRGEMNELRGTIPSPTPAPPTALRQAAETKAAAVAARIAKEDMDKNKAYLRSKSIPDAPAGERPTATDMGEKTWTQSMREGNIEAKLEPDEIEELQGKITNLERKGKEMTPGEMKAVERMKNAIERISMKQIRPAVKLKDGTVVVDLTNEVTDEWMLKMAGEVGAENVAFKGVVQNGKFYGKPAKVKAEPLPTEEIPFEEAPPPQFEEPMTPKEAAPAGLLTGLPPLVRSEISTVIRKLKLVEARGGKDASISKATQGQLERAIRSGDTELIMKIVAQADAYFMRTTSSRRP